MSTKNMKTLKDLLCKELDQYAYDGQINGSALVEIHMLTDTIKNLEKIMMVGEGSSFDGESSRASYGDGYARVSRGRSYGRGYSGEVSSRRGRYSYGDDNQAAIEKLEDMLNEGDMSPDEEHIVRRAMDMLKK